MQEFLLPAVLTLGNHTPETLEVLTAVSAAELEHLILMWGAWSGVVGGKALTSRSGESQVEVPLQTDVWPCGKM